MHEANSCVDILNALKAPWARLDAEGRVVEHHPEFPPVPRPEPGTPLARWFPRVPWPPTGTGPWRFPLDPGRTLHLWPVEGGYLAVLERHGSGLATMPVPGGKAFLNMMVHELRLPLTPIRGYGELMKQGVLGELSDQQRKILDTILANVARMNRLLERLSLLGKIESAALKVDYQTVDADFLIHEVLREHQRALQEADLRLEVRLASHLPPIWTDPTWAQWVLNALLENARMYTPAGHAVTLEAYPENGHVVLAVTTSGTAVPAEEEALVFQPFFRSSDPRVREHRGWGMDLFVAFRLVRYLGGDMGFQNLQEGTRFWLKLPTAPNDK